MSAIVHVTEKARSGSIDLMYRRSYKRLFIVEVNNPQAGPLQVRTAVDPITGLAIPTPGNFYTNGLPSGNPNYEYDHGAWVSNVEASLDGEAMTSGNIQWTVAVDYSPYDTSLFASDPSLWPIKVQFGGERTDRVLYFDWFGNPITNSAGDPFNPPIVIDDSRSTLIVTRNELVHSFDLTLAEMYRDSINQYTWNGFSPNTVKCGIITTTDPQYSSAYQVYYYTVTYPFMINRNTWIVRVLDAGMNELSGPYGPYNPYTDQFPRAIRDRDGQPVADPWPLNGMGQKANVGDPPVVLTFDGYYVQDFTGLNIDLSLALGM
jgi:hypothetical protein